MHTKHIRLLFLYLALAMLPACLGSCYKTDGTAEALPCQRDGQWRLLRTDGQTLLHADHLPAQPTAVVNGLFALPDDSGRLQLRSAKHPDRPVTARTFHAIGYFRHPDVAPAQEKPGAPVSFIDRFGHTVASIAQYPQYDIQMVHNFCGNRALFITRSGMYGYFGPDGQIAIAPQYDFAGDFHDGVAVVGHSNAAGETAYSIINRRGKTVGTVSQPGLLLDTRFANGLLMFRDIGSGRIGYLDKQGRTQLMLPPDALEGRRFKHGLVVFRTTAGTGITDKNGQILLPPAVSNAQVLAADRLALPADSLWILTDVTGSPLSATRFRRINPYQKSGLALAENAEGNWLLIDREGQPASAEHSLIYEDPATTGETVQRFFCGKADTALAARPAGSMQISDNRKTDNPNTTDRPDNQEDTVPDAVAAPQDTDWRKAGRQNPFYREAVKVLSGKLTEDDARNRRMILNYVEHLRTSYNTKDIDFLRQVFSEKALIIVGQVIRTAPQAENGYLPPHRVALNIRSKQQYLKQLEAIFRANKRIDVSFSRFRIMRHPTIPGIYGVTLRQAYRSDLYSDDGYLFLLWDFRDPTAPQIHVRTWQPATTDGHTPLPADSVWGISDFNLY